MLRIFSEEDGVPRALPAKKSPEDLKVLNELTRYWPPVVDGYLFRNEEEVDAVIKLRSHLQDLENDCNWASLDISDVRTLLCFARARKLNIKAAEHMFRAAHAWRKVVEPEKLATGFVLPPVVDAHGTGGPYGFDREGSPVFVDRLGLIDPPGILKHVSGGVDELLECEVCRLEYFQALTDMCVVRDRKPHWGMTIIMDLTGLGVHHLHSTGLQALKRIMNQSDSYYPERAKRVLVINAPRIFAAIWKIVQHFLDPVTREKVQIYQDGATEQLFKYISPDQLPRFLGGTGVNGAGDPYCNPPIRPGGKVPKDFRDDVFEDSFEALD